MLQWCDCGAVTTSYSVTAAEKLGRQKSVATTISSAWASPPSLCIGCTNTGQENVGIPSPSSAYLSLSIVGAWLGPIAGNQCRYWAGGGWAAWQHHGCFTWSIKTSAFTNKGPTILSVWAVILLCTVFLSIFFHQMYLHISIAHNLVIICTHYYQQESYSTRTRKLNCFDF